MQDNSFQIGKYNSVDDWGLKCIAYDILTPPKRQNTVSVPSTSKHYHYPQRYYDQRLVRVDCVIMKRITRHDLRLIAYHLSLRSPLSFWDEPDKYYTVELYESPEFETWQHENGRSFTLTFIAEPFAMREAVTLPLVATNDISYQGTQESPTLIIIKNTGTQTINSIKILAIRGKE